MTASNKGDSEDQMTPDTDDSGAHSYPGEGFKRAPPPVMGNRGLEQRGKKSRTYPPKESANTQKVFNSFKSNTVCPRLCANQ